MVIGTKGKKWLTVLHVVLAAWLIYICIAGIDGLYIAQTADGGRVNSEMTNGLKDIYGNDISLDRTYKPDIGSYWTMQFGIKYMF